MRKIFAVLMVLLLVFSSTTPSITFAVEGKSIELSNNNVYDFSVKEVFASSTESLILKENGELLRWGHYRSIDNKLVPSITPSNVEDLINVSSIVEGVSFNGIIKKDKTLWLWGGNNYGQLGNGTNSSYVGIPQQVSNLTDVITAAIGNHYTLAVKEDGTVWSWGYNNNSQLGDNTTDNKNTPQKIEGLNNIIQVGTNTVFNSSTYYNSSYALDEEGNVWAWGNDSYGQLGNGSNSHTKIPVKIEGIPKILKISSDGGSVLALDEFGDVWAWGKSDIFPIKNDGTLYHLQVPHKVKGLSNVIDISLETNFAMVLKSDNTLWGWGKNTNGELGNGVKNNETYDLTKVKVLGEIVSFSTSHSHVIAVNKAGEIWAWGNDYYRQLGTYPELYNGSSMNYYPNQKIEPLIIDGLKVEMIASNIQLSNRIDLKISVNPQIQAGANNSLVLKEDGTVWRWGHYNHPNQIYSLIPDKIEGLHGVTQIVDSWSNQHNYGVIKEDKTLWMWGSNNYGQLGNGTIHSSFNTIPKQVPNLTDVKSAAIGHYNTLAVKEDGTVWSWGYNNNSQLGDNTTDNKNTPQKIEGLNNIIQVGTNTVFNSSIYYNSSYALDKEGNVLAWGNDSYGQLGNGSNSHTKIPMKIEGIPKILKISSNGGSVLALDEFGDVWAWGKSDVFPIKNDGTKYQLQVPHKLKGLSDVIDISLETNFAMVLKSDNTLWGWGKNTYGELGNGSKSNEIQSLTKVLIEDKVVSFSTSSNHVLAVAEDGLIYSWGYDYYRQLGSFPKLYNNSAANSYPNKKDEPLKINIVKLDNFNESRLVLNNKPNTVILAKSKIQAGTNNSLVLKEDGTVWRWGHYNHPNQIYSLKPDKIEGLYGVTQIVESWSNQHNYGVIKEDKTLWMWGSNNYGQLGNGTTHSHFNTIPKQVPNLTDVKTATIGSYYTLAVKEDGTVWSWGYNNNSQLGDNTTDNNNTPQKIEGLNNVIQVATNTVFNSSTYYNSSYALDDDGNVWAWGNDSYGQLGNGSTSHTKIPVKIEGIPKIIKISANGGAVLALDEFGDVWAWGKSDIFPIKNDGTKYHLQVPHKVEYLSNIIDISLETNFAMVLKSDNTLWGWGKNTYSELGNGSKSNEIQGLTKVLIEDKVVSFSTSGNHVLAIIEDGSIYSWGYDYYRQLGSYPELYNNSAANSYPNKKDEPLKIDIVKLNNLEVTEIFLTKKPDLSLEIKSKIQAGTNNSLVLKEDGTVWRWGHYNHPNQIYSLKPDKIEGLHGVTQIVESWSNQHNYGVIKEDKTLWMWGNNSYGQLGNGVTNSTFNTIPQQVPNLTDVKTATIGSYYILAVKEDGTVWAWGYNKQSQLGDNTTDNKNTPQKIEGLNNIIQVATNTVFNSSIYYNSSYALDKEGGVWSWGNDSYGQLGNGSYSHTKIPVKIEGIPKIIKISANGGAILALDEFGDVWAWGKSDIFPIKNDGTLYHLQVPHKVKGLSNVIDISLETNFAMVLKSDNTLWGWGKNTYGELGNGSKSNEIQNLMKVLLEDKVLSFSTSSNHVLAVVENGSIYAWGYDYYRQLGTHPELHNNSAVNSYPNKKDEPLKINFLELKNPKKEFLELKNKKDTSIWTNTQIQAGENNSLVLKQDGTVWRWGHYNHPNQIYSLTPDKIEGLHGVTQIVESWSNQHNYGVIKEDKTLWMWGNNSYGQLGNGVTNSTFNTIPQQVPNLTDVKTATIGSYYTLAVKEDGTVWAWGYNKQSQLGDNTTTNRNTPQKVESLSNIIQVATNYTYSSGSNYLSSYALDKEGAVWAWGNDSYGQLGNGSASHTKIPVKIEGIPKIIKISANGGAVLALDEFGDVWAWGKNSGLALQDNGTTSVIQSPIKIDRFSKIKDISIESNYAIILEGSGSLWAWGINNFAQLGNGETNTLFNDPVKVKIKEKIVSFSTSSNHVLAVDLEGNIWAWGYDFYRQLGTYPELYNNSAANNYPNKNLLPQKISNMKLEGTNIGTNVLSGISASEKIVQKDNDKINERSYEADPIDTSTGALLSENLVLSTTGTVPLNFTLKYNSLNIQSNNLLGSGWYHNHYGRIKEEDGNIKYYTDLNSYSIYEKGEDARYYNEKRKQNVKYIEKTFSGYNLIYQNGSSLKFNSEGYLIEKNRINEKVKYTYHENRLVKITQIVNEKELVFDLSYNNEGFVSKVSFNDKEVIFEYKDSNLIKMIDANGGITTYEYNEQNQILKAKNANDVYFMVNEYDKEGRIIKQLDANENITLLEYTEYNNGELIETKITDREGNDRVLHHDADYNLISEINSKFQEATYKYDKVGNIIEKTDFSGLKYVYEYDDNYNLVKIIDPKNRIEEFKYDDKNNLLETKDWKGNISKFKYNDRNELIETTTFNGITTTYKYLNGLVIEETYSTGGIKKYEYDGGMLVKETNAAGNEVSHDYLDNKVISTDSKGNRQEKIFDNNNNLLKIINPYGHEIINEYNSLNQLVRTTYPNGLVETFEYDLNGNITKKSIDGKSEIYEFNKADLLNKGTSKNGNIQTYEYDSIGNLIKEVNTEGLIITYKYNSFNLVTEKKIGDKVFTYEYDNMGLLISETNPADQKTQYKYDNYDNLIEVVNINGESSTFEYNEVNLVTKETDANGNSISYEYDKLGNKTKTIDSKGNITTFKYDKLNNLVEVINNQGSVSTFEYDINNNLIKEVNALGQETKYEFDKLNRVIKTTNALGNSSSVTYDNMGRISSVVDALGNVVQEYKYNLLGEVISIKDALGNSTSFDYDNEGNVTKVIDGLNRETQYQYNSYGNVIKSIDAMNVEAENTYDAYGQLIGYKDPNTNQTTYTYNKLGLITKELNATGNALTYEYNDTNLLKKSTNARGDGISYEYDNVGNLIKETSVENEITYTYDENYNLVKIEEKDLSSQSIETIEKEYDSLNRLTKYTDTFGNVIKYSYDELGNLKTLTYPDGKIVSYKYDNVNNLIEVVDWNSDKTTYEYDKNNRLVKTINSNGTYELREYDKKSQLIKLSHYKSNNELLEELNYSYDKVGNLISENEKTYVFDNLNRVIMADGKNYSYDTAGNILEVSSTSTEDTVTFTYEKDNRIATYEDENMNMDKDGNLLSIPIGEEILNGVYNSRNQLIQLGDYTYEYDAEGKRIAVLDEENESRFVFNGNARLDQMLMETDSEGNPISYYVYGLGLISKENVEEGKSTYHFDTRGSTLFLTDSNGEKTNTYSYDVYGEILSATGDIKNPFMYNGQYGVQTDSSGLYFMRNRYYNPDLKRFINRDVIEGNIDESQTFNRFSYVNGNPLNYIDPFGLSKENVFFNLFNTYTDRDLFIEHSKKYAFGTILLGFFIGEEDQDLLAGFAYDFVLEDFSNIFDENTPLEEKLASLGLALVKPAKAGKMGLDFVKKDRSVKPNSIKCACLVAGSIVKTIDGDKNIEDIEVGDMVLSKNEDTGEIDYKEVVGLFSKTSEKIYTLTLENREIIQATGEHPFWIEDEGWVFVEDLIIGDLFTNSSNEKIKINSISIAAKEVLVYNFEVEGFNTYFVSDSEIWTHNCGKDSKDPKELDVGTYKELIDDGYVGDNLTPHHMPSNQFMNSYGVDKNNGVSMNMEQPSTGGRHRKTETYGFNMSSKERSEYLQLSPRDALAHDIWDARRIYMNEKKINPKTGLDESMYNSETRDALRKVISLNKEKNKSLFEKK